MISRKSEETAGFLLVLQEANGQNPGQLSGQAFLYVYNLKYRVVKEEYSMLIGESSQLTALVTFCK